ncbi:MAG: acyltransferase family protein [Cyanobacteriota bacterium]|jgi:peptidoglycan/LPS O-acetylase OafA/YrhL
MLRPSPALSHKNSRYRPEIDGLRAVAIVAVIVNHFNKDWLPSGFLGVDIFFVISGVVITSSLRHQSIVGFWSNLGSFYSRRIKRLLPALCILIVVGAILISLFNRFPGFSLQTGVAALFGFSNLYLFSQSTDYFAPSADLNIFTHTWSLGVEEQFYLFFPLLLWLAGPWRSRRAGFSQQNTRKLFLGILFLSVISLVLFVILFGSHPAAAYFLMPTRFWQMGAGCLLALCSQKTQGNSGSDPVKREKFLDCKPLLSWFALAAILAVFRFFSEESVAISSITIVLLTCLLITTSQQASCSKKDGVASIYSLLSHPFFVSIGLLSYSLYLWHWPVLCISRWTIGTPVWSLPFLLVLMVIFSLISYRVVEQPLRQAVWSVANVKTIFQGVLAACVSAAFLLALGGPLKGRLFTGKGGAAMESKRLASQLIPSEDALSRQVEALLRECNVTPFMLGANSYSLPQKLDREFLKNCLELSGLPAEKKLSRRSRLILLGDSFAEKLAPFAALAAQKIGYDFHVIFGYGCPYLLRSDLIDNPSFPHCRYLNESMLEEVLLASIKPADIVVLRLHGSSKSYLRYPSASEQPKVYAYDRAIDDLWRKIHAKRASLLLVGGNPNLSTQELAALRPDWFNALNRSETIHPKNSQETRFFHGLDRHLRQQYESQEGFGYLSLKPSICVDSNKCLLSAGHKFLYEDDHHLSPFGHELFFGSFLNRLQRLARLPSPSPP